MIKYPNGGYVDPKKIKPIEWDGDGKELFVPAKKKSKKRGPGPEHRIQNDIIAILLLNGCRVWRINVGSVEMKDGRRFNAGPERGFPDICGYRIKDGTMFFIEVKTKKGKRSRYQDYFAKEIADDPVIYGVARSAEEALEIVTKGLNRTEDVK